jgi:hypothetical protein
MCVRWSRFVVPCFAWLLLTASSVSATPIIVPNSTYAWRVQASSSGSAIGVATFDGTAESFVFHGLAMSIDEQQTYLGNNTYQVQIDWTASGDIFPAADESGIVSVGRTAGPPLDLAFPVVLTSAVETFYNAGGPYASFDWVGQMDADPWNGFFLVPGTLAGFSSVGGLGTDRIELLFTATAIPEPASMFLLGTGLIGIGARRWRNRRQRR